MKKIIYWRFAIVLFPLFWLEGVITIFTLLGWKTNRLFLIWGVLDSFCTSGALREDVVFNPIEYHGGDDFELHQRKVR